MLVSVFRSVFRRSRRTGDVRVSDLVQAHVGLQRPPGAVANTAVLASELLARGKVAARAGDRSGAHALFLQATEYDPAWAEGWVWLGATADDPESAAVCLQTALRLEPGNETAAAGLACLRGETEGDVAA
jgi:hypothetical protein